MLLQFRVVVTGIIFQFLFSRWLTITQWFSLLLLTIGCISKQIDFTKDQTTDNLTHSIFNKSFMFIILQVFSSCFAGVYNEYLIKIKGKRNNEGDLDIWVHNFFFCMQSIFCNLVYYFIIQNNDPEQKTSNNYFFSFKVIFIILNNAAAGLVTSIFLKSLNSILKAFASALELVFTAVLSWLILGIEINFVTIISISLILLASWIYANNPVKNRVSETKKFDIV